jgi:aryl-alcohol dehydrogenase-like predicted oxidoreductase
MDRRTFLQITGAAAVLAAAGKTGATKNGPTMITRKIPRSGEEIPVVGMGTYDTMDVGKGAAEREPLLEVMKGFIAAGGRVLDSSPMYGRSEEVVGDVLKAVAAPQMFLATKVWTTGKRAGELQMAESMRLMRTERMDLMQIHNLQDWKTHLATLRDWKAAGKIRYIGITHYTLGSFADMERILRAEKLDFVQLPYSLAMRDAESRLLPAAADTQTAVLVMRPFEKGALFAAVKGKPLPAWAADADCTSWGQLFLKFIFAHPAVTAALPATGDPRHLADNVKAGFGRMLTAEHRKQLIALVAP